MDDHAHGHAHGASPRPAGVEGAAAALHARLLTLDSHIDIPWPGQRPASATRRVDLPKMAAGGLRAGCFAAYVPQGPQDPASQALARERALAMLGTIRAMADDAPVPTALCVTAEAIEAAHARAQIAVVPCVENGAALGGELATLQRFRDLGAIYLTLCHNGHNALCDSANPRADLGDGPSLHGGLSGFGREAIAELGRLGMLVDVSHVSRDAMMQALTLARTPVVATHSCVRALCDVARNLDDAQIDALAASGGLVQITAVPSFLKLRARAEQVTVADYVDHVAYVAGRVGVAHVGISSDFDGGGGFSGWADASESANLTAGLLARGFSEDEVGLMWGGNFLRLLRAAEGAAG